MRVRTVLQRVSLAGLLALGAWSSGLGAQAPAAQQPPPAQQTPAQPGDKQVIRRSFDMVTQDVIVRDGAGQFIPDLRKSEFQVFEDGVQQEVLTFVLTHGGRVLNVEAAPPPPPQPGIILPPAKPTSDASGRIFIIFVDDLHLDFRNTGRIRDLFKKISKELIHDGDLFGILSTGPSSLSIDLTYDRKRLDEAIRKISGAGLRPQEILDAPVGQEGPQEVRYRANVAFSTAYEQMKLLEQVHNRRKAFIYVSNGYDLDPFKDTRKQNDAEKYQSRAQGTDELGNTTETSADPYASKGGQWSMADLAAQLSELTRAANRANATIYAIDPRGLVGMPDIDEKIDTTDWQNYITNSQNSLRVLADLTGGVAVVNQNDFDKALKRIDAETSDYYVVGYYSTNPDPFKRTRKIDIKITRPGANAFYRTSYTLKRPPSAKK